MIFVPSEDLLQPLISGCIGQRVEQELGSGPHTCGSSKATEARSEDPPGTLGPAGPPLLGYSQETCGRGSGIGSTHISQEPCGRDPSRAWQRPCCAMHASWLTDRKMGKEC